MTGARAGGGLGWDGGWGCVGPLRHSLAAPHPLPPPTAPIALQSYAEPVLDALDPAGTLFAARLYRDACLRVPQAAGPAGSPSGPASTSAPAQPATAAWLIKDLSRLGRPLARTVIVDNSPLVYGYQPANGVPVPSWRGEAADTGLADVLPLLEACAGAADVRPVIAAAFPALAVVLAAVASRAARKR